MVQGSALMLMLYMALLMILIRIEFWSAQETQQLVLIWKTLAEFPLFWEFKIH